MPSLALQPESEPRGRPAGIRGAVECSPAERVEALGSGLLELRGQWLLEEHVEPEAGKKHSVGQMGVGAEIAGDGLCRAQFVPFAEALRWPHESLEEEDPGTQK